MLKKNSVIKIKKRYKKEVNHRFTAKY